MSFIKSTIYLNVNIKRYYILLKYKYFIDLIFKKIYQNKVIFDSFNLRILK